MIPLSLFRGKRRFALTPALPLIDNGAGELKVIRLTILQRCLTDGNIYEVDFELTYLPKSERQDSGPS